MRACVLISCAKPLVQREGEPDRRFRHRRFCPGMACVGPYLHLKARADSGLPEKKKCPTCLAMFAWPMGLSPHYWGRTVHCSQRCGNAAQVGKRRGAGTKPRASRKAKRPVSLVHPRRSTVPAGPVWRPAGWSKTPNAWAGHRPAAD